MSRTVYTRDVRYDPIKTAITFAARGGDNLNTREWAVDRWGEAGAPKLITKARFRPRRLPTLIQRRRQGLLTASCSRRCGNGRHCSA
jgi:hypothetical protein